MITIYSWQSLRRTFEARASEWALAWMTVSLGIVSLINPQLFETPGFNKIVRIAEPMVWMIGFMTVGILRLSVLFINGMWWRTPHFRCAFAFLTCFLWFNVSIGLAVNQSFGLAIVPWLFLLDAYNSIRSGKEAGIAQYLQENKKETGG